jgi:hypothetical protein
MVTGNGGCVGWARVYRWSVGRLEEGGLVGCDEVALSLEIGWWYEIKRAP